MNIFGGIKLSREAYDIVSSVSSSMAVVERPVAAVSCVESKQNPAGSGHH